MCTFSCEKKLILSYRFLPSDQRYRCSHIGENDSAIHFLWRFLFWQNSHQKNEFSQLINIIAVFQSRCLDFIEHLIFQSRKQIISLLLVVLYCRKKAYFRLKFRSQPNKYFVSVVKLSVPTVIQQCTPSLSSVVLTACVSKFGIAAMAGYGIVNKLDMILFMPAMCLNMALTAIIGYCLPVAFCKTSCRYVRLQRRSRSFGTALHLVPCLGVPAERGYAVLYGQDQRIRQA